MYSAVIFDLDGTLVDTIEDIASAVNGVLAGRGYPTHESAAFYRMVGNGMRNLMKVALPAGASGSEIDACATAATEVYARDPVGRSRLYPGIAELIEGLRRRVVPMAVLSNKPDPLTRLCVEALFPDRPFRAAYGERPGIPRKPDPAAALALAAELGVEAAAVLYVGDSDVDMETSRRAGFFAVGAAWGFRGAAELAASGADRIIGHPLELLDFFPLSAI